jgi:hypothetical protein
MEALESPPGDGGMWSSRKVAEWIEHKSGRKRPVKAQRGWKYLRMLGNTPQVPRPSQAGADPEEQAAFKKVSRSGKGGPSLPSGGRRGRVVGSGRDASGPQAGLA